MTGRSFACRKKKTSAIYNNDFLLELMEEEHRRGNWLTQIYLERCLKWTRPYCSKCDHLWFLMKCRTVMWNWCLALACSSLVNFMPTVWNSQSLMARDSSGSWYERSLQMRRFFLVFLALEICSYVLGQRSLLIDEKFALSKVCWFIHLTLNWSKIRLHHPYLT